MKILIPLSLISFVISIVLPGELSNELILWGLRIPRVLTAFIAGGCLAVTGLVFQALFRNDLASPYILGVSSAGALGASIGILFGVSQLLFSLFSFLFCLGAIFSLYFLSMRKKGFDGQRLLLSGVALGMLCSSLILFIQFNLADQDLSRLIRWMMGNLNIVGFESFLLIAPAFIIGIGFSFYKAGELNLMMVGDTFASSRGVNVHSLQRLLFLTCSLMTAPVVAELGPIGFVGLIIPHFIKKYLPIDHRNLIIASALVGGSFLALCDSLSRVLFTSSMPVGLMTALIGAPFFFIILIRRS